MTMVLWRGLAKPPQVARSCGPDPLAPDNRGIPFARLKWIFFELQPPSEQNVTKYVPVDANLNKVRLHPGQRLPSTVASSFKTLDGPAELCSKK